MEEGKACSNSKAGLFREDEEEEEEHDRALFLSSLPFLFPPLVCAIDFVSIKDRGGGVLADSDRREEKEAYQFQKPGLPGLFPWQPGLAFLYFSHQVQQFSAVTATAR